MTQTVRMLLVCLGFTNDTNSQNTVGSGFTNDTVRMLLVCPGSYNRGNRQAEKEGTEAKPPVEYFSILTGSAAQTAGHHRRTYVR